MITLLTNTLSSAMNIGLFFYMFCGVAHVLKFRVVFYKTHTVFWYRGVNINVLNVIYLLDEQ